MTTWKTARSIAIWGFGQEGQATLEFLQDQHCSAKITILNDQKFTQVIPSSISVLTGSAAMAALTEPQFDLVIKSPGISLYRHEVGVAKAKGVNFTSGTNLWFETYPDAKTLVVTGTKGKSTTVRLIAHLLEAAEWKVKVIGNIGYPLLSSKPAKELTLLELSSYQIADLDAPPNYCLLTNLFPEHIPWHENLENYYTDKLRLVSSSKSAEKATKTIANFQNSELKQRLSFDKSVIWSNTDQGYHVKDGALYFKNKQIQFEMPIPGSHNLENLALACTTLQTLGLEAENYLPSLTSFQQLPHRLQEFVSPSGQLCVNDSISTVPEATLAALEAYPNRPITLIMGGMDRGQDYSDFAKQLKQHHIVGLMLLPDNGSNILAAINKVETIVNSAEHETLSDAITHAFEITPKEGVILLSPGAPSFGQFRNFQERGKIFTQLCHLS